MLYGCADPDALMPWCCWIMAYLCFKKKGKSLQRCYKPKIHNFSVQPIRVLLIYFTVLFLGFQIFNFSDFRAVAVFYFLDRAVVDVMVAAPSHNSLPFTPAQQQPEWIELSKCTDDEHWNHPVRHFQTSILQSQEPPCLHRVIIMLKSWYSVLIVCCDYS